MTSLMMSQNNPLPNSGLCPAPCCHATKAATLLCWLASILRVFLLLSNIGNSLLLALSWLKLGQYPPIILYHLHHAQVFHFALQFNYTDNIFVVYGPSLQIVYGINLVHGLGFVYHNDSSGQKRRCIVMDCCMLKPALV